MYTSGQVAQDPATGKVIEGGVAAQTEQIFHNLKVIAEAAAKSLADVVKVYARHVVAPYPALTTVAVAALPMDAAVESEMIAS